MNSSSSDTMTPWPVRRDSRAAAETGSPRAHAVSLDVPRSPRGYLFNRGDDSSEEDGLHPAGPGKTMSRPRHARSISNPFPSFFSSGKKSRADGTAERRPNWDSDTSDDGLPGNAGHPTPQGGPSQRGGHHRYPSRDFTSGNCMTCGSNMRWPRELKTFRCTICFTINDLVPRPTADSGDNPVGRPRGTPPRTGTSSPRLMPSPGTSSLSRRGSIAFANLHRSKAHIEFPYQVYCAAVLAVISPNFARVRGIPGVR